MKLVLETRGVKYTIESETDDMCISTMIDHVRGLLVQAGFHPETVDAAFSPEASEGGSWNLQLDHYTRPAGLDMDRDTVDQIAAQTI